MSVLQWTAEQHILAKDAIKLNDYIAAMRLYQALPTTLPVRFFVATDDDSVFGKISAAFPPGNPRILMV